RVGSVRAATAASCLAGGQGRPTVPVLHARHRRRHPLPHPQRPGVAGTGPGFSPPPGPLLLGRPLASPPGPPRPPPTPPPRNRPRGAGRKPGPTPGVSGPQSVKAAEEVARLSRGYDAAKKVNGRKRHIAVDTAGLLLTVLITAASVQDRDAAKPLLWNLKRVF